jgi:mono/diheme cytochrome c family protein
MSSNSQRNLRIRKILFVCAIGLIFLSIGLAAFHKTPWAVPEEEKQRKNPLMPSDAALHSAKRIYADKCANCHGDEGKGDGSDAMMYDPAPADLTDEPKMNKVTDGEIYYQITQGRKPMPSFKKRLTEEQRWQLVLLVRSFASIPAAPSPAAKPAVPQDKKPAPRSKTPSAASH